MESIFFIIYFINCKISLTSNLRHIFSRYGNILIKIGSTNKIIPTNWILIMFSYNNNLIQSVLKILYIFPYANYVASITEINTNNGFSVLFSST